MNEIFLKKADENFEIDWDDFDEKDKLDLQLILENPEEFYFNDFRKRILKEPNNKIKKLEKETEKFKEISKKYYIY